jgi:hypothetical protein
LSDTYDTRARAFRSIVAEPHELARLAAAFDAAWIGVNSVHTIGIQSARARLVEIVHQLL